jgi:hypothetical protein
MFLALFLSLMITNPPKMLSNINLNQMENFVLLLPIDNLNNISNLIEESIKKGDKVSINKVGEAVRIHFQFQSLQEKLQQVIG